MGESLSHEKKRKDEMIRFTSVIEYNYNELMRYLGIRQKHAQMLSNPSITEEQRIDVERIILYVNDQIKQLLIL